MYLLCVINFSYNLKLNDFKTIDICYEHIEDVSVYLNNHTIFNIYIMIDQKIYFSLRLLPILPSIN